MKPLINLNEKQPECVIRSAVVADLERLTELDHMMFAPAYGQELPDFDDSLSMLTKRLHNIRMGGRMLVCEIAGEVNGFGSYFRTDKPFEKFTCWEDATNNGTLDGVVVPNGRYAYVPNMTVAPKASDQRGMQKIMVNLIAEALVDNVDYAYFVSRLPGLTEWLSEIGVDYKNEDKQRIDELARYYSTLKVESSRGKQEPKDYELRAYNRAGFEQGKLVNEGFSDAESLDYGVTFKVDLPLTDRPAPVRKAVAKILKLAARSTRLMAKI